MKKIRYKQEQIIALLKERCELRAMRSSGIWVWFLSVVFWGTSALGDAPPRASHAIPLFTIGKSQNRNQVQYAIHVDDRCIPTQDSPVFAYWRMLELGPNRVAPLLSREIRAYGIATQSVTAHGSVGGKVRLALRAMPNRPILVETLQGSNGTCRAFATLDIAGKSAHLFDVYVKLNWDLGVEYLLLRGESMDGTRVLNEKLGV